MPSSTVRRRTPRQVLLLLGMAGALSVTVLVSLMVGSRPIPAADVIAALLTDVDSDDATVVTSQRLPRTVVGLAAGLALGAAGALMQGHTRNPLADPGLFGVNAGAAFGVAVVVFTFGVQEPAVVVVAALVGAGAAATLLFVLGLGALRGNALVVLAVLGTTLGALLGALTQGLVLLDRQTLDVMRFWDVGSVASRDLSLAPVVLPLAVLGIVLALLNGTALSALGLGEDVARSLGTGVLRARVTGIAAVTLLAGTATALCGPIGFVGLVAPHVVRRFAGPDYRWVVPGSAMVGATVLLVADTLGRVVAPPGELQAGIVMAVVGAPVLVALTRRRRLVAL